MKQGDEASSTYAQDESYGSCKASKACEAEATSMKMKLMVTEAEEKSMKMKLTATL